MSPRGRFPVTISPSEQLCGARLVALVGDELGYSLAIHTTRAIVGRGPEAQLTLDMPEISRTHAQISQAASGEWFIEDLGSRNGTRVNGVRTKGRSPLRYGDRVQFGPSSLFVFAESDGVHGQIEQLQRMEAMGQFASGIAHDFRNIINVIRINAGLLGQFLASEEPLERDSAQTIIEDIEAASRRAEELTAKLLTFARGDVAPFQHLELGSVVGELARLAKSGLPANVSLKTTIDDACPISGELVQIDQMLMNLLLNARDAMPMGGEISIVLRRISRAAAGPPAPHLLSASQYAQLTISDTGEGIDSRIVNRIFDPFFTTKRAGRGSGLGLATTYRVVRRHGGDIRVTTALNQGTSFEVLLPIESAGKGSAGSARTRLGQPPVLPDDTSGDDPPIATGERRGPIVMVAHLGLTAIDELVPMLREVGFEPRICASGRELIAQVEEQLDRVVLVVVQDTLPDLPGATVVRILQAIASGLPTALIRTTAGDSHNDGASATVVAPADGQTIFEAIDGLLPSFFSDETTLR